MKLAILAFMLTFLPISGQITQAAEQPVATNSTAPAENATTQAQPGSYTCKYYTVELPDGWKAIVPPEDQLGTVNAIFATDTGSSVVTMVAGPSGGADAKTIGNMFAEQFKATRSPVANNGQYSFPFPLQNGTATAIVTSSGPNFMVTTIAGNMKAAQQFLKENVKSDNWPTLLPY